jgi:hypothetical protein
MYQVACPECGTSLPADAGVPGRGCENCGWPDRGRPAEAVTVSPAGGEPAEDADRRDPARKRRKRRRPATSRPKEYDYALPTYAVGIVLLLLVWGGLAALARVKQDASLWLAGCGALTTATGVGWLYRSAAEEGVERLSFLNVIPRGLLAMLLVVVLEAAVMPIFCVVYLCFYFGNAWKPFLVGVLGAAMCANGVLLAMR